MTSGKIGEIHNGSEWKVSNFFRLAESKTWIDSPKFSFGDSDGSWYLQCCPRWKTNENEFLSIYLCRDRDLEYEVECSFGLRRSDNSVAHLGNVILRKFEETCGIRNFIKKKELLDQKCKLVPGNTLTVTCTLKFRTEIADSNQKPVLKTTFSKLYKLNKLSDDLKNIFNDKNSYDVILKVKDKEYKAHKFILIARSSVFAANFKHDTLEKQTDIITIPDCDPESFQEFLEYLYCGRLEQISSSSALNLYYTSDKYDVAELKEFCIEYLMQNLTIENVCEVAAFADKYDQTQLYSAVQDFFNKNAYEISETSEWECLLQKDYRLANKILKNVLKVNMKK